MATSTTYDVKLVYTMQDSASTGLKNLESNAASAAKTTDMLGSQFAKVSALIGGGMALGKAKESFIDFNSDIEQSKISIAAVSRMFSPGQTFDSAMAEAEGTFERYQQAAIQSTATTREFLDMHQALAPTFKAAGMEASKLEKIVQDATVAAPLLLPGMADAAGYFARDLQSMLRGQVQQKDQAAKLLLKAMGLDPETFNAEASKSTEYAAKVIQQSMEKLTGGGAKKALEGSYKGITSTLEDTFQILAGKAGTGIFESVKDELKSWNEWLTKNKEKVDEIRKAVGEGLVEGFKAVKSAVSFIVEHSSELKLLVEALLLLRGVGIVGNAISGGIGALSTTLSTLSSTSSMAASGLTGVVGAASNVVMGLGALYLAAEGLAKMVDADHKRRVGQEGDRLAIYQQLTKSKTEQEARDIAITKAKEFGAVGPDGKLNQDKFYAGLFAQGYTTQDKEVGTIMKIVKAAWSEEEAARRTKKTLSFDPDVVTLPEKKKAPPTVNIHVARVEVKSDDPDRFAQALVDLGRRNRARPTQALTAPRI
jgi:hypothetical protein